MIQIIYVASPESQQIHVWKLDSIYGLLELIQVIYTHGQAQPIAIHPNKRFLYVGIRPNFGITTYRINQIGLLADHGTIEIFSSPTHLISDKKGAFLYCTSYRNNTVSVIPISMSGMLLGSPIQIIEGLLGCHSANIDKFKKLLWVPCLKENAIRLFNINSFGMLTSYDPSIIKINVDSGPRHMIFCNFDCYAYVINELTSTVNVIKYNNFQKIPSIVQTVSIIPKNISINRCWAADIHITPNGRWLYCTDRSINIISCLEISKKTKKLKFVAYQLTEEQPRGFAIDYQGKFLVVAGQKSNCISLYKIDSDNGKLTMLSRYSSGKGPMWVSIMALNCK
ncbi:6-phosphogluconolactonase [Candidatus Blochmanniella chromaiodes str. 640]|uniref:6-phosphogluconolactonase n=1 Tax=Candidatus Blochmanniella chromaiodes str. 640 TaxID=1240471 RepID=A0ABM5NDD7_9ENTR|nr:6-phosphogluconolactonase [Candidatus Blochmannia chromaiodes]AGC03619.1 6-phosphogluconolactonase [Candidatus Blochmannia chromaiodes str. 640]